jgi:hypothetical protein
MHNASQLPQHARPFARKVVMCMVLAALAIAPLVSGQSAAQAGAADTADADPDAWTYRIVQGDTLIGIADEFLSRSADWPRLQRLNQIADPLRLVPGSQVRIPTAWLRQTATVAEAVFVRGEVTVQHAVTEPAVALQAGGTLRAGDVLRTAADASLSLRFADGSRLLVEPNSQVAIVHLLAVGRGARPSMRVRLDHGGADAQVVPRPKHDTRFEIRTPAVNLGVRGTEFRARVDAQRATTHLEVLGGRVQAQGRSSNAANAGGDAKLLGGGLGVVAETGKPIPTPQQLMGAPDLSTFPALVDRLPLRLSWPAMAGARGYRAQVLAANSDDQLLLDGVFTDATARWADLPDGSYRLRARALDEKSLEGLNATMPFVLHARPEPPFTSAPAPGAVAYGDAVTLTWARSTAAARYRLQVADAADFKRPLVDNDDLTATSRAVPLPAGVYHWRVASVAADGRLGPFGDAQSYTQRPSPIAPVVDTPQLGPDGMQLRWQAAAPGQKVQFQVATDSDFASIVRDQTTDEAQLTLKDLKPGTTYFLRARTIEADGFEGPFGATQQVDAPREAPWWLLAPMPLLLLF